MPRNPTYASPTSCQISTAVCQVSLKLSSLKILRWSSVQTSRKLFHQSPGLFDFPGPGSGAACVLAYLLPHPGSLHSPATQQHLPPWIALFLFPSLHHISLLLLLSFFHTHHKASWNKSVPSPSSLLHFLFTHLPLWFHWNFPCQDQQQLPCRKIQWVSFFLELDFSLAFSTLITYFSLRNPFLLF